MAFIPMTKKVRPWKRGLAGLGEATMRADAAGASTAARLAQERDSKNKAAAALDQQAYVKQREAEAAVAAGRPASALMAEAARLQKQASVLRGEATEADLAAARAREAEYQTSAKVLADRQEAERQRAAQAAEMAKRGVQVRGTGVASPLPSARTSASGNVAYDIKEDPRYYTKTIDANGNAIYRKVGSSSSSSFSDVLNSIAEVVGVAAPVADRIVQSEQQRKAETLARRAERAAQNGLISSPQPQGSGIQASTVAYGVGGLVAVGVTLWALSSLLGGGSSTPSVVVAK